MNQRAQGEVTIREAIRELDLWGAGAIFSMTEYEDSNKNSMMLIKDWKDLVSQVICFIFNYSNFVNDVLLEKKIFYNLWPQVVWNARSRISLLNYLTMCLQLNSDEYSSFSKKWYDVNELERLSNITLGHKITVKEQNFFLFYISQLQ